MANKLPDITSDFPNWYTRVILGADLADYGPVKGTMIFKPYGFALWKGIMNILGSMINNDLGVEDVYFPMFFPYSYLEKEATHVKGFSPEVAVITHAGGKKLEEPLVVRPTSETIMYAAFSKWIKSYNDLPLKVNQWANVVRWEKRTQFFMRTSEFLWQEGHTAHKTKEEADQMVFDALNLYEKFITEVLGLYGIKGYKTEGEKFAGALYTTTIEMLLQSKKALQSCTSHQLGQGFAKAFKVQYLNKNNKLQYVWQTSWGLSTRIIGALIGQLGDKKGLILPYKLAPIQVVIIPIFKTEQEKRVVISYIKVLEKILEGVGLRIHADFTDKTPGWKFSNWELKGVPLRVEVGPGEVEKGIVTIVDRLNSSKQQLMKNKLLGKDILKLLGDYHARLQKRSKEFTLDHISEANSEKDIKMILKEKGGFIKMFFKDDNKTARYLQEKYKITPRVIPFDTYDEVGNDVLTGEPGARLTLFAKAY